MTVVEVRGRLNRLARGFQSELKSVEPAQGDGPECVVERIVWLLRDGLLKFVQRLLVAVMVQQHAGALVVRVHRNFR